MAHKPFALEKARYRPARLAQRIKEELSTIIPGELKDPAFSDIAFITLTSVDVTQDLRNCRVMFSLAGSEEKYSKEVEAALNKAAGFLRQELVYSLETKVTPLLSFKYDKGYTNTAQIDSLLTNIGSIDSSQSFTE